MNYLNRDWLIKHGNDLPGDVDTWAYAPGFHELCEQYRKDNRGDVSNGAIYRALIQLRKARHVDRENGRKALPEAVGSQPELLELKQWQEESLITLYRRHWMPIDQLPYSRSFEKMFWKVRSMEIDLTEHDVFRHLRNLCKAGKIKREEPQGFLGRKG